MFLFTPKHYRHSVSNNNVSPPTTSTPAVTIMMNNKIILILVFFVCTSLAQYCSTDVNVVARENANWVIDSTTYQIYDIFLHLFIFCVDITIFNFFFLKLKVSVFIFYLEDAFYLKKKTLIYYN